MVVVLRRLDKAFAAFFHAHKTALAMVRDYDVIAHERLSVANMVRTPKPKLDPGIPGGFLPNGAAAKAQGRAEQEHP